MSFYTENLMDEALRRFTQFHGGVSICCKLCKKTVFRLGESLWEHQSMLQFEAANSCIKSVNGFSTLILVPNHVLLLDAGMVVRASNYGIGRRGFHSNLYGVDDKVCDDCCSKMKKDVNKPKSMESMKVGFPGIVRNNIDMMTSMNDVRKNGITTIHVKHSCDCSKLGVQRDHVCNGMIRGDYDTQKLKKGSADDALRVIFVSIGSSDTTHREGLHIWIVNTLGSTAVEYSPGCIKMNKLVSRKEVTVSSTLFSRTLVTNVCWGKRFNNTVKTKDLKCAACGERTKGPMVWIQGFYNVFHVNTCVQTCVECDNTLVPRYGASSTQFALNPDAKCLPLACARCTMLKRVKELKDTKTSETKHTVLSTPGIVNPNDTKIMDTYSNNTMVDDAHYFRECMDYLNEQDDYKRPPKRIKVYEQSQTSKAFIIYPDSMPVCSMQSIIAAGCVKTIPGITKRPVNVSDYEPAEDTCKTYVQDFVSFPRVVYDN
jgi:hypothetical protein